MRLITIILITISLLTQNFSKNLLLLNYSINKAYYTEVLCTNKGLIYIDCEGRCVLAEEIEQEEKKQKSLINHLENSVLAQHKEEVTIPPSVFLILDLTAVSFVQSIQDGYNNNLFHPPKS